MPNHPLVADVPVGAFLSGGIDSSSVVGLLARSGVRVNTFSIVFREADYSEGEFSRMVAREFATDHQEILVSQNDALEAIPTALAAMDQPTIDGLNTVFFDGMPKNYGAKDRSDAERSIDQLRHPHAARNRRLPVRR
jgi:asparagine synthase (glutamine-hydrolysing)